MPSRKPQNGYRRGGKQAYHGGPQRKAKTFQSNGRNEATSADEKLEAIKLAHSIDESMGFARYDSGKKKVGWLCNMHATVIEDEVNLNGRAGVDFYFLEDDGGTFKATLEYEPYFLVAVRRGHEAEVEEWLKRVPGGGTVKSVRRIDKEDLQMPNHLLGYRRTFLECRFLNQTDLMAAKRDVAPIAEKNKKGMDAMDTYAEVARQVINISKLKKCADRFCSANAGFDLFDDDLRDDDKRNNTIADASDFIVDIREFDVPYQVRVAIDKGNLL